MKNLGKIKFKHIEDGKTEVNANIWANDNNEIQVSYKYDKMHWSVTLSYGDAVKMGIVECEHNCCRPVLGYENSEIGEECMTCGHIQYINDRYVSGKISSKDDVFKEPNQYLKNSYKN